MLLEDATGTDPYEAEITLVLPSGGEQESSSAAAAMTGHTLFCVIGVLTSAMVMF